MNKRWTNNAWIRGGVKQRCRRDQRGDANKRKRLKDTKKKKNKKKHVFFKDGLPVLLLFVLVPFLVFHLLFFFSSCVFPHFTLPLSDILFFLFLPISSFTYSLYATMSFLPLFSLLSSQHRRGSEGERRWGRDKRRVSRLLAIQN